MRLRDLTKHQKLVLLVAWLGWVFDVMDASLFAFTKTAMLTEMLPGVDVKDFAPIEGRIQSWFLAGWALGGFVFGILADRWGRTQTLILTILLYCGFTGLTALCQTPDQVLIARFLTALGIGGEWAAGAALVAETVPNGFRAKAAAILQTAAAFGPILGSLANLALAGTSWRWMFVVGVAPALICFLIRMKAGEGQVSTVPAQATPIQSLFTDPKLRRNTIVAMALGLLGITIAGLFPFWLPNIVKDLMPGAEATAVRAQVSNATMILHIGTLAGVLLFPQLCERIGRRNAFGLFFAAVPLVLVVVKFTATSLASLYLVLPLVSFFTIGMSAGFGLYFPELFPQAVRATGAGMAYNVGRVFSIPVPSFLGARIQAYGVGQILWFAGILAILGFLTTRIAPETKGQELDSPES